MDILETNCLTQLSQSARREALPTDYEDDDSDMADEDTLEEDELPLEYLDLGDPHLIDIMNRLQDGRDVIFLPMRISSQQLCEYLEEVAAEVVHARNEPGCFPTEEIRCLFERAAKRLFRGVENRAQVQARRFVMLKRFEEGEEAMRYSSQCHGALDYPGASWRSWCRNTQSVPSIEVCRDALKKGDRVLRSDQLLPRGGIHIVHRLLKEGEAFVNKVLETVIDDDARVSVIRTQLPDIESVYLYDKTESQHNHIQQKLTAVHGDVTYVPGRATFVSEDVWSLASTASMLRRQYSALSERRVFLVKRLGFWTIPGMRMMASPSACDAQQWDQVL